MKKLFLLLALLGMVAVGCSKDDTDKGNDNKTEQPNENEGGNEDNIPENIFFGLDKESVTISPDGGSVDVIVYSNYKWEISGTSDWCTPSVKGGDANEDGRKVTFSADVAYDDREATFWFRCADEKIKFVVSQKFKETIIPDANNTFNIPAEGGVAVISYQTTVDCEVVIPEEAKDWITIAPATRGLVSENINLDIAENTTYDSRSAVIKVVAKVNAELVVEYTINQEQKDAIFADENNTFTVPSAGGEVAINYQTNIDCEVIIPEEAQDWIFIVPETRGLVSENINLDIAENTTYDSRSAVIKVVAKDNAELVVEYTINQEQKDAVIADENNTFTLPSEGGSVVIDYQTNIDCDVIIPDDAQDWVTIAPATRGLVSESITLNIAENTIYSARTAVIKVVAKDNAELAVEYTINQEQNDAVLANGNTEFTISGREQQITIKHKANVDCEVIIPEEAQDWVTIAPATRGLSAYSTTLNIAENNSGKERSCVIKVTSQDDNELSAEYTINQYPRCYLYYTSSDGNIVKPFSSSAFGATILSNTYIDGVGVIEFNAPITKIGYEAFFDCDSLTNITIPDSVTTIGEGAFEYCSSLTSVTIPDSVTTIGSYAFHYCSSLKSVTIGDSVATIGEFAFDGCSSLTSITIPDSVTTIGRDAFCYCSSLTSVTIPDSVTTIGEGAFEYCSSLTSVTIPDSVTTIGSYAFRNCSSLTTITIPDSVTTIGDWAFNGCSSLTSITIPNSVTTIGEWAFSGCTGELIVNCNIPDANYYNNNYYGVFDGSEFTSVTIGDSVTTIGNYAFEDCNSLTSVAIPYSVTTIGEYAFYDCSSLTSVTIPDSVTTIGSGAFSGCTGELFVNCNIPSASYYSNGAFYGSKFTSVTIGDSVTIIGKYAFYDCSSLTSVTIGDSVTTIGRSAFYGCTGELTVNCNIPSASYYSNGAFYGGKFTSVTIGDSVTTIGNYAFEDCNSLTSVAIPYSVTTIGEYAFYDCSSLTSVTIPDSVTTIGSGAFSGCTGELFVNCNIPSASDYEYGAFYGSKFTSVTIGDSVTSIGAYAFYNCSSLTSVTIPDSVTTIGEFAFDGCSSLTSITIPDSVTTIGNSAFDGCRSLTSVTIPDSVTTIGEWAFYSCDSLTSVTIGDSVTTIGDYAFYECSSLTSVTIPDSVTKIGDFAFNSCSSLTSVYCKTTTPPVGGYGMFYDNASGRKIYVPMESVNKYKSASYWSSYKYDIVGYNF